MVERQKVQASAMQSSDAASVILPAALYLGPCSSASSAPFLAANSITHVLSIGSTPSPKVEGVIYRRLSLNDSITSSITTTVDTATEIVKTALRSNKGRGRILVHCSAGVSRSPTIVCGYLMKKHKMTLKTALGLIIRARSQASPNSGFLSQLKELEMTLLGSSTLGVDELPRREVDRLALFNEDGEERGTETTVDTIPTAQK